MAHQAGSERGTMNDINGLSSWVPLSQLKSRALDRANGPQPSDEEVRIMAERNAAIMARCQLALAEQYYRTDLHVARYVLPPWWKRAWWYARVRVAWVAEGFRVMWRGPSEE